ncbi:MAG: adenylate/guanylate cyclase domain-containing protein [Dehalococcoidia bacterium]
MGGEVRYCTTEDGVRIAYTVEGEGPPLLAVPFFLESFSLDHLAPEFVGVLRLAARGHRLIRYDTRGTGLSQREVDDMSNDSVVRDMEAVVGALALERFSLWGTAAGGFRALTFASRHPDMIDRLILHAAWARIADTFSDEGVRSLAGMCRLNWEVAARTLADFGSRRESEELGLRMAELYTKSVTGEVVARLFEDNVGLDVTQLLPNIEMPTLIFHHTDDALFPIAHAQQLAVSIPNAHFVPLPGPTWVDLWFNDEFVATAHSFLTNDPINRAPVGKQGPLRTVLVTDLAASTDMMSRLGDQRGRDVLREHERIIRDVLKAHDGAEVKTMGDGFMASFASVTRAVECAIALQRAFAERNASAGEPLTVRVGLDAGEPIEEEGDLFGATVILASRVAAKADGGEILVSDVVRGLCSGKGFLFADRGEYALRGFEDPVRIYEVAWRS